MKHANHIPMTVISFLGIGPAWLFKVKIRKANWELRVKNTHKHKSCFFALFFRRPITATHYWWRNLMTEMIILSRLELKWLLKTNLKVILSDIEANITSKYEKKGLSPNFVMLFAWHFNIYWGGNILNTEILRRAAHAQKLLHKFHWS